MYGWTGKILDVDLGNLEIRQTDTQKYSGRYIGGRGIASRIYWERVSPRTGAFDPQNHLILMTGPLVATGAQGATRMSLIAKSPMTLPEQYCYGNLGGFFPAELKKAGWDGIIISGRASVPLYLWIEDDHVELRDGTFLFSQGACEAADTFSKLHGRKARFLTTGISGRNRVRSAIIFGSHQSTSTAGFGAVMGAKNLMAIVVLGRGRPEVYDAESLKELNRITLRLSKGLDLSIPPDMTMSGRGHILERIGRGGCYQCGLDCIRNSYRYGGRPDLTAIRRCQSMEYYLPWRYNMETEPVDTFFHAPDLANDYGVCTFELRNMINWLYACHKEGVLTEAGTGLPLSRIGSHEFLEKLLKSISLREGIGDILAEGLARAVEKFPEQARAMLDPKVQPVGEVDINMPRSSPVHAIMDPAEPRMNRPLVHAGFARTAWMFNKLRPGSSPITSSVFREIARRFWGSTEAADFSSCEGKALAALKIQNRNYIEDTLGLCDFAFPLTYSFSSPDGMGDPDLESKYFEAATGIEGKEIYTCAERIANLQRMIQLREGRRVPVDDYPDGINFTTPLPSNRPVLVPGPGDEPVDMAGRVLDRDEFTEMLKEYYRLRGWDEDTGLPKAETMETLGLKDLQETSG
jgi:aldehyde:ferredoxin oxidoreductase